MRFSRRHLLGAMATLPAWPSLAQGFPSRPITVIEPFAAGGAVDGAVRAICEKAATLLGQPMLVDARPGGGTRVGTELIRRANPDGHTIGVMVSAAGVNIPSLDPRSTYDPVRDFTLLTLGFEASYVIVAHPSLGLRNLQDLIDYGRKNPGKLSYGSSGMGTSTHLWMEIFQDMTRTQFVHAPYRGEAASVQDLVGGHIQLLLTNVSLVKGHVDAGRLNVLAYPGAKRTPLMPQLPTTAEAGLPGYLAGGWVGFIGPAGMPPEVASRLTQALRTSMAQADVIERVERANFTVKSSPPDEFANQIRSEIEKMKAVGKSRGIVLND